MRSLRLISPEMWTNMVLVLLLMGLGFSRRVWQHAVITFLIASLFLYFLLAAALRLGG